MRIFEIEKERDEQVVVSSVLFRVNSRGWIGNRRQNNLGRVSRPIVQHFVSRREILDGKRERGDGIGIIGSSSMWRWMCFIYATTH